MQKILFVSLLLSISYGNGQDNGRSKKLSNEEVREFLKRKQNHNSNDVNLKQFTNNPNYFIKTFDVNKDGIKDKVVSHNRYKGEEMLVFLGDKVGNYSFALKSTNFSEDGGNQISDIKETKDGFQIITQFPDHGFFQKNYFITSSNNFFILKKIKSEMHSWQDGYAEKCIQNFDFNLNNSLNELYKKISNTKESCTKKNDNQSKGGK